MNNNSPESFGGIATGGTAGATEKRSVVEIIKDIVEHIQEIVRCEIRLAGTDLRDEATRGWAAARLVIAGAVVGILGLAYLLLSAVWALAIVWPPWAAALAVGGVVSLIAAIFISTGVGKWNALKSPLRKTTESLGENVEWLKQQVKS